MPLNKFAIVMYACGFCLSQNCSVGLLDADIYGPSIPRMMNLSGNPELNKGCCYIKMINCVFYVLYSNGFQGNIPGI